MNHMLVKINMSTKRRHSLCRTPLYKCINAMMTDVEDVDCKSCIERLAWRVEDVMRSSQ